MIPNLGYGRVVESRLSRISIDRASGCWNWTGKLDAYGYGRINVNYLQRQAHRVIWEMFYGPVPNNIICCHDCDNRGCVNPSHIYLGTHKTNSRDMDRRGRRNQAVGRRIAGAKLTDDDVREIRKAAGIGRESLADISRRFGVSRQTIAGVVAGAHWAHVKQDGHISIPVAQWRRLVELVAKMPAMSPHAADVLHKIDAIIASVEVGHD